MADPNEAQFKETRKQHEVMRQQVTLKDSIEQTYQRRNAVKDRSEEPSLVHDKKRSFSILQKCKKLVFPASADDTAEGQPVMEKHKEKTWKDKRAEDAHAETAKAEAQDQHADHYSYDMVESLRERSKNEDASFAMYRRVIPDFDKKVKDNHVDLRVIRMMAGTYKTDEKGMPIDVENAKLMEEERKKIEAYVSGDLEMRKPILEDLVKELIDKRIEPSMMNYEYMASHAVEMKNIGDKMIYIENVMKDPINKPFFEQMEPAEKEMLQAALTIADAYTGLLDQMMRDKAVNMNKHEYIVGEPEAIEMNKQMTGEFKKKFEQRIGDRAIAEQQLYEKYQGEIFRKTIKDCANPNPDLSGKADFGAAEEFHETMSKKGDYVVDGKPVKLSRVEHADVQFAHYMKENNKSEADSCAKQALGIRFSSHDSAVANKKLKGTMFDSLAADYKDFFKNLGEQDMPFDQMSQMVVQKKIKVGSAAGIESGGGVEAITVQLLSMFKERVTTPECAKYLAETYKSMGKAKIFDIAGEENRIQRFVAFQMQCLLNSHAANANIGVDSSTPLGIIAKGASRNCLGIYRLSEETSKEDMAKIKEEQPGVYEMLKFYKEMEAEVTAMLTHILVGKQAAVKAADKKPE